MEPLSEYGLGVQIQKEWSRFEAWKPLILIRDRGIYMIDLKRERDL